MQLRGPREELEAWRGNDMDGQTPGTARVAASLALWRGRCGSSPKRPRQQRHAWVWSGALVLRRGGSGSALVRRAAAAAASPREGAVLAVGSFYLWSPAEVGRSRVCAAHSTACARRIGRRAAGLQCRGARDAQGSHVALQGHPARCRCRGSCSAEWLTGCVPQGRFMPMARAVAG
ncbi:hypothetical protein PLESTF_000012900 [Pleodorina starrii]|nr:hypothetical protein PLESTF_000012900 [Pleodorina starrii]